MESKSEGTFNSYVQYSSKCIYLHSTTVVFAVLCYVEEVILLLFHYSKYFQCLTQYVSVAGTPGSVHDRKSEHLN